LPCVCTSLFHAFEITTLVILSDVFPKCKIFFQNFLFFKISRAGKRAGAGFHPQLQSLSTRVLPYSEFNFRLFIIQDLSGKSNRVPFISEYIPEIKGFHALAF
jgi:hypothetical protein